MNNILIAGDLVPKENNNQYFQNGNIVKILGEELYQFWNKSNFKFFNLEAPITNNNEKIIKCGPNLKINKNCILGIKRLEPSCVFLANNHINDYSEKGIVDTINELNNHNINYIGIGENINNLNKSYTFSISSKKVVIYNCCDYEFSGATEVKMGTNECNILSIFDEIKELKSKNDYVIIIYHGGKECYRYPSPYLQKLCRKMVESGADLVTCQHTHCIGCYEDYKNKKIIYGQGNFIFDGEDNEYWNTSILLNIEVTDKFTVDFVPIVRTRLGTRMADSDESKKILSDFEKRSQQIKQSNFIEREFSKFADREIYNYLFNIRNTSFLSRVL